MPRSGGYIGIFVVARDHTGLVLVWSRKKLLPQYDIETSKLYAAKLAIMMAKEMGFNNIIVEGDALQVINNLTSSSPNLSGNGAIYSALQSDLSHFAAFQVCHVRREANTLAHNLCHDFVQDEVGYLSLPFDFSEPS